MADEERKRLNTAKLRQLTNLIERRLCDSLAKSEYFDVEVRLSVRHKTIQPDVEVTIRHKDRLN